MKREMMETINRYEVEVVPLSEEDGGGYLATFPQLGRMITGLGETREAAMKDLLDSVPTLVESLIEAEEMLPEPETRPAWRDYSGRVTLRLPRMLHAQLDRLADREGVSLNSLMTTILQSGATALLAGKQFGAAETYDQPPSKPRTVAEGRRITVKRKRRASSE